jgi:hypothetical protein
MPRTVSDLSSVQKNPNFTINVEAITQGGASLNTHWSNKIALQKIRERKWDVIVLQEHNSVLLSNSENKEKYIELFLLEIKKVGAKAILYNTPIWNSGSLTSATRAERQININETLSRIGKRLDARVAPIGYLLMKIALEQSDFSLYTRDYHPSELGSYFAACVFYSMITNQSPELLPPYFITKSRYLYYKMEQENYLRSKAWKAVSLNQVLERNLISTVTK